MQRIYRLLASISQKKYILPLLLCVALILHLGTTISGGLYADDYVHKSYFMGSQALQEKGFLQGIGVGKLDELLSDQFNFFDPREENYQALMQFGMLPWWAGKDAMLHFFRPLATVSHYIDYRLWPDNTRLMHGVSLLWYVLGVLAIYCLYRGVGVEKPVALLALLLVILDHSMFQVVTWIASRSMLLVIAFGFFTVYAYHKSLYSRLWYVASLAALLLAALSAEAVVAICAYLGAYMFTMDKRPWLKRIVHILPFALLIIIWHLYYQSQGYGAYGVDFYLDPGHEPRAFLQAALYRLPGNFFELTSGIDVVSGQIRPDIHRALAGLGVLAFVMFMILLWSVSKTQPVLRFFFLGSCLSLIPGLTIALSPRVMILPFAGMAVVLAYITVFSVRGYWQGVQRLVANTIAVYVVIIHVFLSLVLAAILVVNMATAPQPEKPYGYVDLGVQDIAGKQVVLINAFKPFWLAFYAHYLGEAKEPLPASLRVLASAFYPVTVTRLSKKTLLLEASPAFQYDAEPLVNLQGKAFGHVAYLLQELMGLIRAAREEWLAGSVYAFPEMTITVNHLYKGKPDSLTIELLQQDMDDYRWSYWHKGHDRYETFVLPDIGKSVVIEGIFDAPVQVPDTP